MEQAFFDGLQKDYDTALDDEKKAWDDYNKAHSKWVKTTEMVDFARKTLEIYEKEIKNV